MRYLAVIAALALAACQLPPENGPAEETATEPATGSATPDPTVPPPAERPAQAVAAWDGRPQAAQWTEIVLDELDSSGAGLLGTEIADADALCPAYPELTPAERKLFYLGLVSRMAQFESGFDPETRFTESFTDSTGQRVVSRGLLQLSIESARGYQGCSPPTAQSLHDPRTNLHCGIVILNRWVSQDGVVGERVGGGWRGGARYWSVLRETSPRRTQIEEFTRNLPVCRR